MARIPSNHASSPISPRSRAVPSAAARDRHSSVRFDCRFGSAPSAPVATNLLPAAIVTRKVARMGDASVTNV